MYTMQYFLDRNAKFERKFTRCSIAVRDPQISPKIPVSAMLKFHWRKPVKNSEVTYLVARDVPTPLRYKLFCSSVDIRACRRNFVLQAHTKFSIATRNHEIVSWILTTVKSSNGLAVSMFFNVVSNSRNSPSTLPFVSSALFTACTSNASMAFICRPTSYVAGLNALNCPSISSTTAVLLRLLR